VADQRPINPPVKPTLVAYEPFDAEDQAESIFEQVLLQDIEVWPEYDDAMPWRFDTCKLERCNLIGQPLGTARIWDSILVRCDMSALKLFGSGILRTELLGCRLTGTQLGEASVKDAIFQNCKLNMASFRNSNLERIVFENCILDDVDFNGARLTDVVFINCEMSKTDFSASRCLRVDMTKTQIGEIRGVHYLKNVRITPEQVIDLAPLLCAETGLVVQG
jgi:uncharacterized protein YjbI with pentapeptide repeats